MENIFTVIGISVLSAVTATLPIYINKWNRERKAKKEIEKFQGVLSAIAEEQSAQLHATVEKLKEKYNGK